MNLSVPHFLTFPPKEQEEKVTFPPFWEKNYFSTKGNLSFSGSQKKILMVVPLRGRGVKALPYQAKVCW